MIYRVFHTQWKTNQQCWLFITFSCHTSDGLSSFVPFVPSKACNSGQYMSAAENVKKKVGGPACCIVALNTTTDTCLFWDQTVY